MTSTPTGLRAAAWLPLLLFGAWPFLSFLDHNRDDALVYGGRVLALAGAFVLLLLLAASIGKAVFARSSVPQVVNALAALAISFFTYLPFSRLLAALGVSLGTVRLTLWLVASLLIAAVVFRLSRTKRAVLVANVVGVAMVAVPAIDLGLFALEGGRGSRAAVEEPRAARTTPGAGPNVYWFVFDMYARADVLKAVLGYDNAGFLEALEGRGFFVADEAVANYTSTKLSLSTTATMDYYLPVGGELHPALWTDRLQGYNAVVDRFHELGYRYIHAEPGGSNYKTRCGGREEQCITAPTRGFLGISEAEAGLLKLTPLFPILRVLAPGLLSFDFTEIDDVALKVRPETGRPHFLFAHILSPHPPPRYGTGCRRLDRVEWELVADDTEEAREAYRRDLACLNPLILRAVDEILKTDASDPVVILQGDHGLKLGGDEPRGETALEPWTAMHGILHAIRLPERCRAGLSPRFSAVNTFRLVFGCIEGTAEKPLPNRIFRYRSNVLTELVADY